MPASAGILLHPGGGTPTLLIMALVGIDQEGGPGRWVPRAPALGEGESGGDQLTFGLADDLARPVFLRFLAPRRAQDAPSPDTRAQSERAP